MSPEESALRMRVVEEARSWVSTPYHHRARVKGAGVDCAQLVLAVYASVGVIEDFDPGHYPSDWHLHKSDELYLRAVLERAIEIPSGLLPLPGDLMLMKFGNTYSHGAIVIKWPLCVHALLRHPVGYIDMEMDMVLRDRKTGEMRPSKFFSYWPREAVAA